MAIKYYPPVKDEAAFRALVEQYYQDVESAVMTDQQSKRQAYNPETGKYDIEVVDMIGEVVCYTGCVLCTREENGYDDSDFYAVVWSEKQEQLIRVDYASTRYYSIGHAVVDATPEVLAKARAWLEEWYVKRARVQAERESEFVKVGRKVKVVRGRKVPVGTTGVVKLIRDSQWGQSIVLDTGSEELWVALKNVEVLEPSVVFDEAAAKIKAARQVGFYVPFVRSGFVAL